MSLSNLKEFEKEEYLRLKSLIEGVDNPDGICDK